MLLPDAQLAPPLAGDEDAIAAYAKLWFKLMFHDEIKHKLEMKADTYKVSESCCLAHETAPVAHCSRISQIHDLHRVFRP